MSAVLSQSTVPSCLAVIPARGGSKGIPRKNLQRVGGLPLVARTSRAALAASTVTRVVVSTDDAEIAAVARVAGAEVVQRPAALGGDRASSESALVHVLEHLDDTEGYQPELLVFLQCTSPLTLPADIDGTVAALLREGADSAFTASPEHPHLWRRDGTGAAVGVNHDSAVRLPRQQVEPQFLETGAVYAVRAAAFRKLQHRFIGRVVLHEVPRSRAPEVDDPSDLDIVRALAARLDAQDRAARLPNPVGAIVFDFDGVHTDDSVLTFSDGTEAVLAKRGDGLGVERLRRSGIPAIVVSKERNPVVAARCRKLQLDVLQGVDDKLPALREWAGSAGIDLASVVYLGNDINDLDCLLAVGCGVVVADAHPDVLPAAQIVLDAAGGRGAVRELIDLVLDRDNSPDHTASPSASSPSTEES